MPRALFDYDSITWGLLHGSTLAPVSASVIVTSVLYIQSHGHGTFGGPLLLLLSCGPFDSALGVFMATFLQTMVLDNQDASTALYLAPCQIIGGVGFGCVMGVVLDRITDGLYEKRFIGGDARSHEQEFLGATGDERTKAAMAASFNKSVHGKTFMLVLSVAAAGMLVANRFGLEGAGSLFVVALGASLANQWNNDPVKSARKNHFAVVAGSVWNLAAMPALFAFVGASVHLADIFEPSFLYRGILVFICSLGARFLASSAAASAGTDFTGREKFILGVGFIGKASAQATLGLMVYERAHQKLATLIPGTPEYAVWKQYLVNGKAIGDTSVIMIMCAAPLSSILLRVLGRRWVRADVTD